MDRKVQEKELLSMWKKKLRLMMAKRNLRWVELPKPIRKGYVRTFVLREDVAKSKEGPFFKELLKHVNTKTYCMNKDFMTKPWNSKKKIPITQGIQGIYHDTWNKLNLTDKQKSFFEKVWKQDPKNPKAGHYVFEFTKPWMFETKIFPHYVTHTLLLDPQLESELREITNKIETNGLMPKLGKMLGWTMNYKYWEEVKQKLIKDFYIKKVKIELQNPEDFKI